MKTPWHRPAPTLTDQDPEYFSRCWHHGPEPIGDDAFHICGECGHVWTADELLARHNAILAQCGRPHVKPRNVDTIDVCPLCTHDF